MNCWDLFVSAIKTEATKTGYCKTVSKFKDFCGVDDYCDFKKMDGTEIKKHLTEYVVSIKHLRYSSCNKYLCAIELFLDMNEIPYPKRIIRKMLPSDNVKPGGDIPYTTEEIKKMLETTNSLKNKFIIHMFVSTGLRLNGLYDPLITLGDIIDMPDRCKAVLIYRGSKEEYWTFWTPECVDAFNAYLNSRRYRGEYLTNDSPLLEANGKPMAYRAIRRMVEGAIKRAGIQRTKTGQRFDKALTYGFRKRFNTILKIDNSVNANIAEKLMAHKKGLDGTYLKPTREECYNEFRKAIQELTIYQIEKQKAKIVEQEKEISEKSMLQEQVNELSNALHRIQYQLESGATVTHPDQPNAPS